MTKSPIWLDASTATWLECRDYLESSPFAILPLGATEQHGPHLPQNTDTVIAEALATAGAKVCGGLVLPSMPIGYSWVWRDYPGSLTHSFNTFRAMVKDIARSMDRNGCKALMLISGHGANPEPLKYTIRELADEMEMALLRVFYPGLGEVMSDAESPQWQPGNFHAEEFETSMMLHLRPDLVDMGKARHFESSGKHLADRFTRLSATARPSFAWETQDLNRSGAVGNAAAADAERGRAVVEAAACGLVDLLGEVGRFELDRLVTDRTNG